MDVLRLKCLPEQLAVCRLPTTWRPSPALFDGGWLSLTYTGEECSLVIPHDRVPEGARAETGWRAVMVEGPLDFSLTGILARLADPLARAEISLFAVSTFDTDFILVRAEMLDAALEAWQAVGIICE